MGRAEREILDHLREIDFPDQAWDSSRVARLLFRAEATSAAKIRQTYRVLERTRIVPDAMTADELILRSDPRVCRNEVKATMNHARRYREQISIVQVREVRLGQWAVTWNNLRLARYWLWLTDVSDLGQRLPAIVDQLLASHRLPCCLLFDKTAPQIRDHLIAETDLVLKGFGIHGIGYSVSESK